MTVEEHPASFAPLSSRRLLIAGGIALILLGMVFGDLFAVFVLHQNAGRIGAAFDSALQSVAAGQAARIPPLFAHVGSLLENHGTKVDAHVHMIGFGYLALFLALVQPFVAFDERGKRRLAWLFLTGAFLLPVGVFLIHYVGLAWSPFAAIGWASVAADFGGLLVFLAVAGELVGLWRHLRGRRSPPRDPLFHHRGWATRVLLSGGTLLILAGFLFGAWDSAVYLYPQEAREHALLVAMTGDAAANRLPAAREALASYNLLQAGKAVRIAAHAHIIEFGLLALLLAFLQPCVFLSERWRRIWVRTFLAGSVILPVFVLSELRWGLVAGGIADFGGLLVVLALGGMLVGVIRHTGKLDAAGESLSPEAAAADAEPGGEATPGSSKLLMIAGLALALWGMGYGLYYAVLVEHQTLDAMGTALTSAFTSAAERSAPQVLARLADYAAAEFVYFRQVDAHSHWIGLAMLLFVLGLAFVRVGYREATRKRLAWALVAGSVLFPAGVLWETASHGLAPKALAAGAAAVVIVALALVSLGFARASAAPST
jgi:hypothetical protein